MATGQVQQVVVMQPMQTAQGQTNAVGTVNGGETNAQGQTTVVVVQQPVAGQVASDQGNRFPRWSYLLFGIGMGAYNFVFMIFWLGGTIAAGADPCANSLDSNCDDVNPLAGYGALFFFCGFVPSFIAFIWMINDSTVYCTNPGTGDITKICCCSCINGWVMVIPMCIAAFLRFILWCAFFGILADFLNDWEAQVAIDNVFWMIVSIGSIDVGPFILTAIDWWWYYGKLDYNGLFGHKLQPLRCITGESILIMICSWSLIAVFEEYADDAAAVIWPWILHGILSTAILVFAAFLQFSGSIQGPYISNGLFKFVCWGFGIVLGILTLIVWGYILSAAFGWGSDALFSLIMFIYAVYYGGLTVPTIWALFSIKVNENNQQNPV